MFFDQILKIPILSSRIIPEEGLQWGKSQKESLKWRNNKIGSISLLILRKPNEREAWIPNFAIKIPVEVVENIYETTMIG